MTDLFPFFCSSKCLKNCCRHIIELKEAHSSTISMPVFKLFIKSMRYKELKLHMQADTTSSDNTHLKHLSLDTRNQTMKLGKFQVSQVVFHLA